MYLDTPEFLDSGRKCLTLDSARWTLDAGLCTLFDVSPNFPFTASKTMCDYYL